MRIMGRTPRETAMIDVLSQMALLLLAGTCGLLLGRHWLRRHEAKEQERWNKLPDYGPQLASLRTDIQDLRPQGTVLLRLPSSESEGDDAVDVARQLAALDARIGGLESSLQELHRADASKMKRADATALLERVGAVEASIAAIPATDLSPVVRRIDETQAVLRTLEPPPPVDLKPIVRQLNALLDSVQCIRLPDPPDMRPLQRQMASLQEAIGQMHIPDAVDLKPIYKQIAAVESAVHSIEIPRAPDPVDLNPVREKLGLLSGLIEAIRIPPPPDLTPLQARLTKIELSVHGIEIPEPPPPTDLQPISKALARLEQMVTRLPSPPDMGPLRRKLNDIEERIVGLPIPEPVDVRPLHKQVASVKEAIYEIRRSDRPQPLSETNGHTDSAPRATTDLAPIDERLARLEAMFCQALSTPEAPAASPESKPVLFDEAEFGPGDDLKQINGVGPGLERALHRAGVWYFWQISGWNDGHVNYMDSHLDGFKGRIRRHNVVEQATELAEASDRRPPADIERLGASTVAAKTAN